MRKIILTAMASAFFVLSLPVAPEALTQNITVGTQCSRPGPLNDNDCTVMYRVASNPSNRLVCTWIVETNGLFQCEGKPLWSHGFDSVPPTGVTLEFRRHASWPTTHPSWPGNPEAVRNSGTLLRSQFVASRYRPATVAACSTTVSNDQDIQAAINAAGGGATICLASGVHSVGYTIRPMSGQTIRSEGADRAVLSATTAQRVISLEGSAITLQNIEVTGNGSALPEFGVLASGAAANDILLENVRITKTLIGLGTTAGATNVELRSSEIAYTGDGLACAGCASPAVWINGGSDVRIIKSTITNNGASPEGDGELACYNSSGLVVHNSTITDSGAAGMYLVNCDFAVVSGNEIVSSGEWGLDLVDTGQSSGSDYGLFSWNYIEGSRHGAGVLRNSLNNTFQANTYNNNRQGPNASGSCNGINRRGNTSGYYYINDVASPWPVVCND